MDREWNLQRLLMIIVPLIVVLVLVGLVLAGGGDDDDTASPANDDATSTAAADEDSTDSGDEDDADDGDDPAASSEDEDEDATGQDAAGQDETETDSGAAAETDTDGGTDTGESDEGEVEEEQVSRACAITFHTPIDDASFSHIVWKWDTPGLENGSEVTLSFVDGPEVTAVVVEGAVSWEQGITSYGDYPFPELAWDDQRSSMSVLIDHTVDEREGLPSETCT
ncbi:MAG: hypothetical protein AAGE98_05450 [Actinomycetota bacterium]